MPSCSSCKHLDLRATEKLSKESKRYDYAAMGLWICGMKPHGPATFITGYASRKCELFDQAPDHQIERRIQWLEAKQK